ncbi:spore cortex biosynthesis protein YabQ [Desulfotomaculum copahuensis]|uniref:Spore cortex biosynthesis protein YabQ n=1 Tax=Desulfotomaculum copahuensis TaxID=1838280 RepID=A0A1B7LCP5_9FIRM|nr:spore cortex biosynthesis protein YabQ [Desulfotomaculum copahuensis]OAT80681.1 spore cortex biosynthesis protein YabQ [Desulfotomaculum copahuensis]
MLDDQLFAFVLTLGAGMLAGFLYDCYRVVRELLRPGKTVVLLGDLLYWLLLTGVVFAVLLAGNQGEVRFYLLLGLGLGALVYLKLFSPAARRLIRALLHAVCRLAMLVLTVSGFLWQVIAFPFKMLYLAFALPCRWAGAGLHCAGRGVGRLGRCYLIPLPARITGGLARRRPGRRGPKHKK